MKCTEAGIPIQGSALTVIPQEGTKFDVGKLMYELIPVLPLRELARVYTIGAQKYSPDNWRKGLKWRRVMGALERHYQAFKDGESIDPQDGQHHLASVVWCAFALMQYEKDHPELDDRYLPSDKDGVCKKHVS